MSSPPPAAPPNPHKTERGLARLVAATGHSWNGLRAGLAETAFRQELALCVVLVPIALLVELSAVERVLLLASLLIVLIVELLNTAIEATIDRISVEQHDLSRRAKDLGSAAVMLSLCVAALCWVGIFGPRFL